MNSPSNRRHAWSWLPVEFTCGGLLFVGMAASIVMAQENPTASPPPAPTQPAVSLPVAVPEFLPRLSPVEQKILLALSEPTEVAFTDIPLEEALNYLKDLHGIEIWIDKGALSADGIATDHQVTLNISGITLRSALRLLLEPMLLSCVIEDEVLKITTQDAASKRFVTRTYPAGDLFESREEANELVEVIVSGLGLNPQEKEAASRDVSIKKTSFGSGASAVVGPSVSAPTKVSGTIVVSVKARAIVARQTHAVHDQVRQLLRDLREAKSLAPERPGHELNGIRYSRDPSANTPNPRAYTPGNPALSDEFSPGVEPDFSPSRSRAREPDGIDFESPQNFAPPSKPKPIR